MTIAIGNLHGGRCIEIWVISEYRALAISISQRSDQHFSAALQSIA